MRLSGCGLIEAGRSSYMRLEERQQAGPSAAPGR